MAMDRMTGPGCAVMCNFINTRTHNKPKKTHIIRMRFINIHKHLLLCNTKHFRQSIDQLSMVATTNCTWSAKQGHRFLPTYRHTYTIFKSDTVIKQFQPRIADQPSMVAKPARGQLNRDNDSLPHTHNIHAHTIFKYTRSNKTVSAEYRSTEYGCQTCSRSAKQGQRFLPTYYTHAHTMFKIYAQ